MARLQRRIPRRYNLLARVRAVDSAKERARSVGEDNGAAAARWEGRESGSSLRDCAPEGTVVRWPVDVEGAAC